MSNSEEAPASGFAAAALSVPIILAPLLIWRLIYQYTDFSLFALIPLGLLLWISFFAPDLRISQQRWMEMFKEGCGYKSGEKLLMTGRLGAGIRTTLYMLVAVPILAWQAVNASRMEILALILVAFASALITLWIFAWAARHMQDAYQGAISLMCGPVLTALISIPFLYWMNCDLITYAGEFRAVSLQEALTLGFLELPDRKGLVAELLAPFYALEILKFWLVLQASEQTWGGHWIVFLFCAEKTLIAFLVARSGAGVALWLTNSMRMGEMTDQPPLSASPKKRPKHAT